MKETIRFKGLTLNKDEQLASHGELSLCGGVELHDGSLRPSVLKERGTVLAKGQPLPYGGILLYVHETDDYRYFITYIGQNSSLAAYQESSNGWTGDVIDNNFNAAGIRSITSVGNTLCVMNTNGVHYFLCHVENGDWVYRYLGQQPPFLEIQFGLLRGDVDEHLYDYYLYDMQEGDFFDPEDDSHTTIDESQRSALTDHVLGKINMRLDEIAGDGRFYAPFLIRYCYRMYDGSMVMHSAPVLMMPMLHHPAMTWCHTLSHFMSDVISGDIRTLRWYLFVRSCKLQARLVNASVITELNKWSDVIRSVDVFITPQFSRIDTSKMIEKADVIYQENNYAIWGLGNIHGSERDESQNFADYYSDTIIFPQGFGNGVSIVLPEYSEVEFFSRIRKASYFYKLCTIELEDIGMGSDSTKKLNGTVMDLKFDESVLKNIAVQEQMADDYKTHNILLPYDDNGGLYTYNHRLNCYGISERLFPGIRATIMFPIIEPVTGDNYTIRVYVKTDNGIFAVECTNGALGSVSLYNNFLLKNGFIFYPDARAITMVIYRGNSAVAIRRLTASDELNGSLSFCDDSGINDLPSFINNIGTTANPVVSNSLAVVSITNKIYTSRADNPFYFPNLPDESGINTVGNGNILRLAVPMRSLTQDQAGFNDLIVFSTDGIWIVKVSKTGTYSEMHNISSEVLYNIKSVCQLDQSVVFATSRALAKIVGQDVASLTEVLDGPYFDVKNKLKAFSDVFCIDPAEGESYPSGYDWDADSLIRFNAPPLDFYRKGKVFYDYIGSRIIVLPADTSETGVALVFSIRDEAWSTMVIPPIQSVVDGYPYMYIQFTDEEFDVDGKVMRLDLPYDHSDNVLHTGVVVTRTLTFSDTMDVLRGFRQMIDSENMPQMYMFGSNDQRTWKFIGNSSRSFHNYIPGHPYRFFRLAMYIRMLTAERYQQIELEIINKYAKL